MFSAFCMIDIKLVSSSRTEQYSILLCVCVEPEIEKSLMVWVFQVSWRESLSPTSSSSLVHGIMTLWPSAAVTTWNLTGSFSFLSHILNSVIIVDTLVPLRLCLINLLEDVDISYDESTKIVTMWGLYSKEIWNVKYTYIVTTILCHKVE